VRRAVVLLLAAHAAVASFLLARNVRWKLREAKDYVRDDESAARRRLYGEEYANALEKALEAVPRTGSYRVSDLSGDSGEGVFVRWEMAPRRAVLTSDPRGPSAAPPHALSAAMGVTLVVLPGKPPRIIQETLPAGGVPSWLTGREDVSIPSSIDLPSAGMPASPVLVVQGWCQERGGRPCETVRFYVDGEELTPRTVERFRRPDVEAAVPGIGETSRAGYRARLGLGPSTLASRQLSVLFVAADGRWRILGPVELKGTP
jgi:hypothetical protein